ncbi:hypothetical protein NP493_6025g00002 [Ridgeia piscesae]|uniref:protein-tyrosine-phosphatase n=1 Tax=Ridgeia piscesae TaxID=27915 RepID=A0AAD9MQ53_RIDPI|nr:hypothetical protein NP493_6025g00002 [Ridgeia piscesae]
MRRIYQLHFTSWPDKGTPQYAYPLLAFRRKLLSLEPLRRGPLVVHCSAGIGRTGTFIAIDILTNEAATEGHVDVFSCVNQLRTQRMNMVQTLDQYVYIYQALIEARQETAVSCSQLKQTFDELCREEKLAEQFKQLNVLTSQSDQVTCAAREPSNVGKNRDPDIVPSL